MKITATRIIKKHKPRLTLGEKCLQEKRGRTGRQEAASAIDSEMLFKRFLLTGGASADSRTFAFVSAAASAFPAFPCLLFFLY